MLKLKDTLIVWTICVVRFLFVGHIYIYVYWYETSHETVLNISTHRDAFGFRCISLWFQHASTHFETLDFQEYHNFLQWWWWEHRLHNQFIPCGKHFIRSCHKISDPKTPHQQCLIITYIYIILAETIGHRGPKLLQTVTICRKGADVRSSTQDQVRSRSQHLCWCTLVAIMPQILGKALQI